jgi:hypothetical protein
MSSMNFNQGEGWREYQRQMQESQRHAESESNRNQHDPLSQIRKEDPQFVFSTAFILMFQETLTDGWDKLMKQADLSMVLLALEDAFSELKELFAKLAESDVSMDVKFLNSLSNVWEKLEHASSPLKKKSEGISRGISEPLHTFMFSIGNCKEGQQYSLVHYLKEHAGVDWVPFPFMQILQRLHEEYKERGRASLLANWLDQIELILNSSKAPPTEH